MGQEDHTLTTGKKGSHFTAEQRTVLEWLWNGKGGERKEQRSPARLAALLGKSRRTIYRELKRGMTCRLTSELETIPYYRGELVQSKAEEEKRNHGPAEKIGNDRTLADAIGAQIKEERYSPYAVRAVFQMDGWTAGMRLCAKTIYCYVAKGMLFTVTEADMPRGGKPPVHSRKGAIQRSIATRSEAGHWEMDTVKGPQNVHTDCLLTLTERKTRPR